jgi:hypothetical protein
MNHSRIDTYEKLLKQSFLIPELVTQAADKDINFLENLNLWLVNTEAVMIKHNISKCSEIAGLRSKIIAVSYAKVTAVSKKKRQLSVATSIIYDAQSSVLRILEPLENQLEETRAAIRQLLGVAYQTQMINPNDDFNAIVQTLWVTFSTHEQLKGAVASILVLVNKSDALRILAEEIDISILKN